MHHVLMQITYYLCRVLAMPTFTLQQEWLILASRFAFVLLLVYFLVCMACETCHALREFWVKSMGIWLVKHVLLVFLVFFLCHGILC